MAQPVPRRPHGGPSRRPAARRAAVAVSPVERRSCLLCTNGWIEGDGNVVEPCPNCRPGVKAVKREACRRCNGNGTREFAPDVATTCARCGGNGLEPPVTQPPMTQLPWGAAR